MLEVTTGLSQNQVVARQLVEALQGMNLEGSLYIGYPVLATADETVTVDALLVSRQHGLVMFLLADVQGEVDQNAERDRIQRDLDRRYVAVENTLSRHDALLRGRGLAFDIRALAVVPVLEGAFEESDDFVDLEALPQRIGAFRGRDYSGKGIHEAARIAALGNGGEILASEQTLAGASGGFPTSQPRTVSLKGISEPVQVVAVDWR